MSTFGSHRRAARGGFTLMDVAVMAAAVSVMAVLLVPAIARARASAAKVGCQSNLNLVFMGLSSYASDNASSTPHYNGTEPGAGGYSGWTIWNAFRTPNMWPPCYNPDVYPPPQSANGPAGLGQLVVPGYVALESLWCPNTRFGKGDTVFPYESEPNPPDYTWWDRKDYFGAELEVPWGDLITGKDGQAWWPRDNDPTTGYDGHANSLLGSTYAYRGYDASYITSDWVFHPLHDRTILKQTHPKYPLYAILIDYDARNHWDAQGANVAWGDGTVNFWYEPNYWRYRKSYFGITHTWHPWTLYYEAGSTSEFTAWGVPWWNVGNTYTAHTAQFTFSRAQMDARGTRTWGRP